jgi:hypothetical protein
LSQQGGFAVSRASHDGNHIARAHFEVDSVENAMAAKRFVQILNQNLDTRLRHSSSILRLRMKQK